MYLEKVLLENIKKYVGVNEFSFDDCANINTISGKNGSGKSTVFESIILCQKAYFVNLIEPKDSLILDNIVNGVVALRKVVENEFKLISSGEHSRIGITFKFLSKELVRMGIVDDNNKNDYCVEIILDGKQNEENSWQWDVIVNDESGYSIIEKYWNLQKPKNIIMYLDADKNVYEDDFTYEKISMVSNNERSPIINFILNSKSVYQNMYDIMMKAYIYQRVNPQKPRKDDFFVQSKSMFTEIMDKIEISNFSGKQIDNQFVVVAKNTKSYDARNLSSGEKLIWYVLLVLNYIKEIGILIIDEPENHLHEQLAWKFIMFIKSISDDNDKELRIGEVFLITHAKNLIYNNFAIGKNYIMTDAGLEIIDKSGCENVLRECGISFTEDKILFVEGDMEVEHLTSLCSSFNIKIKQLSNSAELIQVYKNLLKVKELVYVPQFVFMIDRDTRDDLEIKNLRKKDEVFFDSHICFLPVHEIENFLLDENIISDCINAYISDMSDEKVEANEVEIVMKKYADSILDNTKKKYLNNELHNIIKSMSGMVKQKEIVIGNIEEYKSYTYNLFLGTNIQQYLNQMLDKYNYMQEKYGEKNWSDNWRELCDGKVVFERTCSELGKKYYMNENALKEKIFRRVIDNKTTKFYSFWHSLIELYN